MDYKLLCLIYSLLTIYILPVRLQKPVSFKQNSHLSKLHQLILMTGFLCTDFGNGHVLEGLAQVGTEYTYGELNMYIILHLVNDKETASSN
jgi:hypothetical protein